MNEQDKDTMIEAVAEHFGKQLLSGSETHEAGFFAAGFKKALKYRDSLRCVYRWWPGGFRGECGHCIQIAVNYCPNCGRKIEVKE